MAKNPYGLPLTADPSITPKEREEYSRTMDPEPTYAYESPGFVEHDDPRALAQQEMRVGQRDADAEFKASIPWDNVSLLTPEHIMYKTKGGKAHGSRSFFGKEEATAMMKQSYETDAAGNKIHKPLSPEVNSLLQHVIIHGKTPLTFEEAEQRAYNVVDAVDLVSGGFVAVGDVARLMQAAATRDPGKAVEGSIGMVPLMGTALIRSPPVKKLIAKVGGKAKTGLAKHIEAKAVDPQLRFRAAQTLEEGRYTPYEAKLEEAFGSGKVKPEDIRGQDPRLNVGEGGYIEEVPYTREDIEAVRTQMGASAEQTAAKIASYEKKIPLLEQRVAEVQRKAKADAGEAILDFIGGREDITIAPRSIERLASSPEEPKAEMLGLLNEKWNLFLVKDGQEFTLREGAEGLGISKEQWRTFIPIADIGQENLIQMELREAMSAVDSLKLQQKNRAAYERALLDIPTGSGPAGLLGRPRYSSDVAGYEDVPHGVLSTRNTSAVYPPPPELVENVNRFVEEEGVFLVDPPVSAAAHLRHLSAQGTFPDPAMQSIATKLSNNKQVQDTGLANVSAMPGTEISWHGLYGEWTDSILINSKIWSAPETILHETAHAASVKGLHEGRKLRGMLNVGEKARSTTGSLKAQKRAQRVAEARRLAGKPTSVAELTPEQTQSLRFFDEMEDLALQVENFQIDKAAKADIPFRHETRELEFGTRLKGRTYEYGGTNVDEFVAEAMADSDFRAMLMEVKYIGPEGTMSGYDKFLNLLANLLGFTKQESHVLFQTMETMGRHMDAPPPGVRAPEFKSRIEPIVEDPSLPTRSDLLRQRYPELLEDTDPDEILF